MDAAVVQAYLPYVAAAAVVGVSVLYLLNKSVREVPTKPPNYFSVPVGEDGANCMYFGCGLLQAQFY